MIRCWCCKAYFEPDNEKQAYCNDCSRENPGFAHFSAAVKLYAKPIVKETKNRLEGVDGNWEVPQTPEEEQWLFKQLYGVGIDRLSPTDTKKPEVRMIVMECHRCGAGFEAKDLDEVNCLICRDTNPGFDTDQVPKAEAQWQQTEALIHQGADNDKSFFTPEEEIWFGAKSQDHTT